MSAEQPNDPAWGPSPLLRVRQAMQVWDQLDHARREYWRWLFEEPMGTVTDLERLHRAMLLDPHDALAQMAYRDAWLEAGNEGEPWIHTVVECKLRTFLDDARTMFSTHPITEVVLTDCTPLDDRGAESYFGGDPYSQPQNWHWLPCTGGNRMSWELPANLLPRIATFDSLAGAELALSLKAVSHGRSLAGLPPLPV